MKSSPTSAINLRALLDSLLLSQSPSKSSSVNLLAEEIKENHDFGPFADGQLYEELAQMLWNCKERCLSQRSDSDDDLDEELANDRRRESTQETPTMGTWRARSPSPEIEDDVSFQSNDDDVDEELKEDLESLHLNRQAAKKDESHTNFPNNLLNRFDSLGNTENISEDYARASASADIDVDVDFDSSAHTRSSSELPNGSSHVTPTKPRNRNKDPNTSVMDDFGSPCSFATARETMDTLDRKIEKNLNPKQGRQTQDRGNIKPQPIDKPETTKEAARTPFFTSLPDDSDADDSDLFSPVGPSVAETPLSSNVPNRAMPPPLPPVMTRAPSATKAQDAGQTLFGLSEQNFSSVPIPPSPKEEPLPTATFKTPSYPLPPSVNSIPFPPATRVDPPPVASTTSLNFDPIPLSAAKLPTVPLFKVDLSNKEKGKITGRGSPRNRARAKIIKTKTNLVNLSVNATHTNATDTAPVPPLKTPVGFTSDSFMKSPEEMELDTPIAANENKNTSNGVGIDGFSFNIGAGNNKTPSRKGPSTWKSNRKVRGSTRFAASPSAAQNSASQRTQFPFSPPKNIAKEAAERTRLELRQKVTHLRDTAKSSYTEKRYKDSVAMFTEAIIIHTNNFTSLPKPLKKPVESEALASMYGNRAAGLMMLGAFKAAASDCEQALKYLIEYNPVSLDLNNLEQVCSYLKADGGLTYMAKFLARMGRAQMKCGKIEESEQTFDKTARVANAALSCHKKIINHAATTGMNIPHNMQKISEKILNQCLTDATLNKSELSRVRENLNFISKQGGVRRDVNSLIAQKNNPHLIQHVSNILQSCPSDERMQENMVICLASIKKWDGLIRFCELIACKNAEYDGVFVHDLGEHNPHKAAPPARFINQNGVKDAIEDGTISLDANQAAEASLRLPSKVVKLYTRALRLEEKYKEGEAILRSLDDYSKLVGPIWSPNKKTHKARYHWLSVEKDKIKNTLHEKSRGDSLYRDGRYQEACGCYARVILVDLECNHMYGNVWETNTMGGRLHAVLFCNRAACLMALKKYDEATKECTAALKIEKGYMKAILRRARCYNRLERFEESIAEYNRWTNAVQEARRNPHYRSSDECPFDRAVDVTEADFQKSIAERTNVEERRSNAALKNRQAAEEGRRRAQSAHNRRQQYQDFQNQRRWDSFGGTAPNREKKQRSPYGNGSKKYHESYNSSSRFDDSTRNNQRQEKPKTSPTSNSVTCHYAVLQVSSNASQIDVKKAYRKMALKYHPDKNGNCQKASDVFRKVQLAYETLSDERSKRKYDVERLRPQS